MFFPPLFSPSAGVWKNFSLVKVTLVPHITKKVMSGVPLYFSLFRRRGRVLLIHLAPFILITKGSGIILQLFLEEVPGAM